MGLRGIIVAGLAGKERRDFLASEARQRASLHRLPTFAVLVLDGAVRRPIASPVAAVLAALAGREVAIVMDPPALVFDEPEIELAAAAAATSSGSGPASGSAARAAGPGWPGCAGSPTGRSSRPAGSRFDGWPPGAGPARRPRAVRLTLPDPASPAARRLLGLPSAPMSVPAALERRFTSARPGDDPRAGRAAGRCRPPG